MTTLVSATVNPVDTAGRSEPRRSAEQVAQDSALAERLPERLRRLTEAQAALDEAYRTPMGDVETHRRFGAVTKAHVEVIAAGEAAYRASLGRTTGLAIWRVARRRNTPQAKAWLVKLDGWRYNHQAHLLSAGKPARVPNSIRATSRSAYGPHGAGMHSDPSPALGPASTRTYGVDPRAILNAEASRA